VNMAAFPTTRHVTSWAGMCPGNDESAGKRRNPRTNPATRYLRAALCEAAWAASHTKNTYPAAQYKRLVRRMPKKKALIAVGHTLLVIVYKILSTGQTYRELGGASFVASKPSAWRSPCRTPPELKPHRGVFMSGPFIVDSQRGRT